MTSSLRLTFGLYFIAWGLAIIFLLPEVLPQKLINYIIIGAYVAAIFWWLSVHHYGWTAYWIAALQITCVVTFVNLNLNRP